MHKVLSFNPYTKLTLPLYTRCTHSCINMAGFDMSKSAAQQCFKQTGLTAQDVQVVELHGKHIFLPLSISKSISDIYLYPNTNRFLLTLSRSLLLSLCVDCFSCNELITYEALGLCPEGQAGKLVDQGQVTYGGKVSITCI